MIEKIASAIALILVVGAIVGMMLWSLGAFKPIGLDPGPAGNGGCQEGATAVTSC